MHHNQLPLCVHLISVCLKKSAGATSQVVRGSIACLSHKDVIFVPHI